MKQNEDDLLTEILRVRKFIIRIEELQCSDVGILDTDKKQLNLKVTE